MWGRYDEKAAGRLHNPPEAFSSRSPLLSSRLNSAQSCSSFTGSQFHIDYEILPLLKRVVAEQIPVFLALTLFSLWFDRLVIIDQLAHHH